MNLTIRKAIIPIDAEVLFTFEGRCFNRSFDNTFPDVDALVQYFGNVTAYIASIDNVVVGYIGYTKKNDGLVEIVGMAVYPEYQRQGVGSALLTRCIELEGEKEIELITHPENTGAVICYLKFGFLIKGWKDNFFGDGQPRIVTERKRTL